MSRRNTSTLSDEEIFSALVQLTQDLGRIPVDGDLNMHREFPLNASGLRRRFGSLERALLLAGVWFPQPSKPSALVPLRYQDLPVTADVRAILDSGRTQVLQLTGTANPEKVLIANASAGTPVGGFVAVPGSETQSIPVFIQPLPGSLMLLDGTQSARGFQVLGRMVRLKTGQTYGAVGESAMVIVYNLDRHGIEFSGFIAVPADVDLMTYAGNLVATRA